jgi:hypothetical protein
LPFKLLQFNTGGDSEDQFLSIGLTDALITRLSKIRRVVVPPTSAVVRFAETDDAFQAGKQLDAINELAKTRYVSPYMLAMVYCSLDDRERAFEFLEKALAERDVGSFGSKSIRSLTACATMNG